MCPIFPELEYGVQVYGIHADFTLGRHVYQEISDALQGLEIGVLGQFIACSKCSVWCVGN